MNKMDELQAARGRIRELEAALAERAVQPRLGGRKLFHILGPELEKAGVNIGRDRFSIFLGKNRCCSVGFHARDTLEAEGAVRALKKCTVWAHKISQSILGLDSLNTGGINR
jgi:hypothetical protein